MKRIANISVIAFASMFMLALSVIPHHHHNNGTPCFITDQREHDCDIQHADHQNTPPDNSDNSTENSNCVIHTSFIAQQTDSAGRLKSYSPGQVEDNQFYPGLFICILADLTFSFSDEKPDYGEFIFAFSSFENHNPIGLRAPPYSFI